MSTPLGVLDSHISIKASGANPSPPSGPFWLRSSRSSGDSFVYKLTTPGSGTGIPEIYVEAEVWICQELLDILPKNGGTVTYPFDWFEICDLYGDGGFTYPVSMPAFAFDGDDEGFGLDGHNLAGYPKWATEADGSFNGPITATGSHTVTLHMEFASDTYVYVVDGVTYDLSGNGYLPGYMSQADHFGFGAIFSSSNPSAVSYVTNVLVKTSPSGTVIVVDDFSGGLSAWDGVVGNSEIVDNSLLCMSGGGGGTPLGIFDDMPSHRAFA